MSQNEVISILRTEKAKWFTLDELSDIMEVSKTSANKKLRKLIKYDFINDKISYNGYHKKRVYRYKNGKCI